MSACAWIVAVLLVGQVGGTGGRYPTSGNTNPFSPTNQSDGAAGNAGERIGNPADTRVAPLSSPTAPGASAAPGVSPPPNRAATPYGTPTNTPATSPGSGGMNLLQSGGGAAAPNSGTYPWGTGQSTAPAGNASSASRAAGMMRAMLLVAPTGSRLPGTPISLADAVSSASSREEQSARVEAYWDLCSSVADYYLGVREQSELAKARASRTGTGWQQAESELAVRVGTSQSAALASQYRLASLMGMAGTLPLPADIPHCGDYNTHYDRIFAGRSSAEARELANLLPKRYAELKDAEQTVTRAEQWLNSTAASDNSDGIETVQALKLLALQRRAFVQIARDYNRRIARYTELSTPGEVAPQRLIGMLIRSGTSTAIRTNGPGFNRQSQNAPSLPKTFGEGWEAAGDEKIGDAALDAAVKQASGEEESESPPREERSLLVNPPQ